MASLLSACIDDADDLAAGGSAGAAGAQAAGASGTSAGTGGTGGTSGQGGNAGGGGTGAGAAGEAGKSGGGASGASGAGGQAGTAGAGGGAGMAGAAGGEGGNGGGAGSGGSSGAGSGGGGGDAGTGGQGGAGGGGAGSSGAGGGGSGGDGGSGGSGAAGAGAAGAAGQGGQPVLSDEGGEVYSNEDGSPIEGATITVVEGAPTTVSTTDAAGKYDLMLPEGATVFMRANATGFYPMMRGFVVPAVQPVHEWYLPATATIEGALQLTGISQDAGKGTVWVSFENAKVAGYTAKLSAKHGDSIAVDPSTKMPAKASATLSGGLDFWFVVFTNVEAGKTQVEIVPPVGHSCVPRTSVKDWRVDAGVITYVDVDCDVE